MVPAGLSDAKQRLLERLKRVDSATASELAAEFDLTETGVRQHLDALEQHGLVQRCTRPAEGRGRPPLAWSLTFLATELFPDRHGDLTVELLDAIRAAVGEDGLEQVIDAREARQLRAVRGGAADRARREPAPSGRCAGPSAHRRGLHGRGPARR